MAKKEIEMVDVPESKATRKMCPLLQRNCVGSRCASCLITGVTEIEDTGETENLITCNNPNVNKNAEVSESVRYETATAALSHGRTTSYSTIPSSPVKPMFACQPSSSRRRG